MDITRGDVHFLPVLLPEWAEGGLSDAERDKFVVALRSDSRPYVPVVLASTNKRESQKVYSYEVDLDPELFGFPEPTLIDCRWVFSLVTIMFTSETYRFTLDWPTMQRVSAGLINGLQIQV